MKYLLCSCTDLPFVQIKSCHKCFAFQYFLLHACLHQPQSVEIVCVAIVENASVCLLQDSDNLTESQKANYQKWNINRNCIPWHGTCKPFTPVLPWKFAEQASAKICTCAKFRRKLGLSAIPNSHKTWQDSVHLNSLSFISITTRCPIPKICTIIVNVSSGSTPTEGNVEAGDLENQNVFEVQTVSAHKVITSNKV